MPSMTFRFLTECEMTLEGQSYEETYLLFKDFQHGIDLIQRRAMLNVCPPESDQIFFALDNEPELYEIPGFKGSFQDDIAGRCRGHVLKSSPVPPKVCLPPDVIDRIPKVYG